jgi:hypothetical protein
MLLWEDRWESGVEALGWGKTGEMPALRNYPVLKR